MGKIFLVTGGSGFIGANFIQYLLKNDLAKKIINLDKLTYAGNPQNLLKFEHDDRYVFNQGDICDQEHVRELIQLHHPDIIVNFAAESHVDRSIDGPGEFIKTNISGTYTLLQESLRYYQSLENDKQKKFRFHHVSTDEVFGSLGEDGFFTEETPYDPSSPYSASKAASDHLVRAWERTYGLPIIISNCSNNYGPYQFPEKLIPLMILNCLAEESLPVYGTGENVRDWLYVDDHADALQLVLEQGKLGESYNIGGFNEHTNLDVVHRVCDILDELLPESEHCPHRDLITFVTDRPGHDQRYAIDATKINRELGWTPKETFTTGLRKTVEWYIDNREWNERVMDGSYQQERLGLGEQGS